MTARRGKSKKPSGGSKRSPQQPEEFTLYLDENLCNSAAILETLQRIGVRCEQHLTHFPRGARDEEWLPLVGKNRWVLLTTDKQLRYNLLERRALQQNSVREFVFTSGNMSGQEMADALALAIRKMWKLCRKQRPPFVAAITRGGEVHLRWPKP